MCQLLGLAFNESINASLSFRGFRHRASGNPHGWGLATYNGAVASIMKEPRRADRSDVAETLVNNQQLASTIMIGHVRYGNVGGVSLENTHPFVQKLRRKDFVLAHNGTLEKNELKPFLDGQFTPTGTTDSELVLCVLLTWMITKNVAFTDFVRIQERLHELNRFGNMNLLFSEGQHLFAYHDSRATNGLCFTHRKAPFSCVTLCDEDWTADLPQEKSPSQHGYIIATKPLTHGENWSKFKPGQLIVFKNGESVFGRPPSVVDGCR